MDLWQKILHFFRFLRVQALVPLDQVSGPPTQAPDPPLDPPTQAPDPSPDPLDPLVQAPVLLNQVPDPPTQAPDPPPDLLVQAPDPSPDPPDPLIQALVPFNQVPDPPPNPPPDPPPDPPTQALNPLVQAPKMPNTQVPSIIKEKDFPYLRDHSLSEGDFGFMYKVTHHDSKKVFAYKYLQKEGRPRDAQKNLENKAKIIRKLEHCHVVGIVDTYIVGRQLRIIIEPVSDINLKEFLYSNKEEIYNNLKYLKKAFRCLAWGLSFIYIKKV